MAHAWVRDSNATLSLGQGLSTSGLRAKTGPPSHPIQPAVYSFIFPDRLPGHTVNSSTVVVLPYVRSAFLTWPGVNLCEYKLKHKRPAPV